MTASLRHLFMYLPNIGNKSQLTCSGTSAAKGEQRRFLEQQMKEAPARNDELRRMQLVEPEAKAINIIRGAVKN